MLGTEGTCFLQANPGFDARGTTILNGEGVDGGLESVVEDFAGLRLGEVAEHHGIFKAHWLPGKQVLAHEGLHLPIQHVIAADEAQIS